MGKYQLSLCWDCANAVCKCPWSKNFTPVKGWKAIPVNKTGSGYSYQSYLVEECPLFVADGMNGGTKRIKEKE